MPSRGKLKGNANSVTKTAGSVLEVLIRREKIGIASAEIMIGAS
jgi:hypothetical protein